MISDLIGSSAKFQALIDDINTVAPVGSAVLIQGETGTGKEMIARAIHEASPRRHNRFVAVNCAAIPSALLESELFGHERGAFTGAETQTMGRFQLADRGTLFLDEIGDFPLELQPKLLRALQEKQFERLGSSHTFEVDVRVIAATNQDLWRMVEERKFRADLYYRLNVIPLALAPLREREGDIPLLVEHFVQKFAQRHGKGFLRVPYDVMETLKLYEWPGNVRELQNVIERGVIMTTGPVLSLETTDHMRQGKGPAPIGTNAEAEPEPVRTLVDAERAHIAAALRESNGVVGGPRGAAAQLGLPRTTLIARMQRLGISGGTSRRRAERSNRQPVRPRGGPSGVAHRVQEETGAYGQSSGLRDSSAAGFRKVEAAAGGSWGVS
jgi:formate hydrogenlyase transcriptional activator